MLQKNKWHNKEDYSLKYALAVVRRIRFLLLDAENVMPSI